MATERTTRNQRRLLVGFLGVTTSLAVVLGITALDAGGEDNTSSDTSSDTSRGDASPPATASSDSVRPAPSRPTTTTAGPGAVDTSTVAAGGDTDQPLIGTTQECRADPTCASSEHRTSDPCGAALIVDLDGYLEGRHDAEQGRPYQIDGAPAPTPADDDDDDGTVGPQTLYRAGYVQGWCDGGGAQPAAR
jgi:hypothetical protein